jgi:bacteriorhodopsin
MAIVAYLWVLYTMLYTARARANAKGRPVSRFYTQITSFALMVLTAYPIVWAMANGSRRLSVDGEIIVYGILDVLAKGVFGAWLLFMHNRVPETHVEVGGFWTHGFNTEGTIRIQDDEGA